MLEMNKVMLIGNLTRDPEATTLSSGMALTKIGIAVSRRFKNAAGEYQDEVTFVDLTAWSHRAEFAGKYLKKGTRVYVEGRLNFSQWEKDGVKRSKLDVTVDQIDFVLSKAQQEAQAATRAERAPTDQQQAEQAQRAAPAQQAAPAADPAASDLPF